MSARLLLLETSQRRGWVALARGETVLGVRSLDETRRHARDLAPFAKHLLDEQNWKARDLEGIVVDRGPGSYTGLRVGVMSAKTLAFAVGCPLVTIDAFAALALQAPEGAEVVDVVADAQQEKLYAQRFRRTDPGDWRSASDLSIVPFSAWLESLEPGQTVIGPGLEGHATRIPPEIAVAPEESWAPRPDALLRLALHRLERGERDDPFAAEPLYLRPSSAEENWKK